MKSKNTIYEVGVVDKVDIGEVFIVIHCYILILLCPLCIDIAILIGGHKVDTIQRNLLCPPDLFFMSTF